MRDALPLRCEAISASTGKAALVACDEFKFGGHVRRLARCAQGWVVVKRWRKIYLTSFLLRFLTSLLISSSDGDAADFLFDMSSLELSSTCCLTFAISTALLQITSRRQDTRHKRSVTEESLC
jgi:hypothetical protein